MRSCPAGPEGPAGSGPGSSAGWQQLAEGNRVGGSPAPASPAVKREIRAAVAVSLCAPNPRIFSDWTGEGAMPHGVTDAWIALHPRGSHGDPHAAHRAGDPPGRTPSEGVGSRAAWKGSCPAGGTQRSSSVGAALPPAGEGCQGALSGVGGCCGRCEREQAVLPGQPPGRRPQEAGCRCQAYREWGLCTEGVLFGEQAGLEGDIQAALGTGGGTAPEGGPRPPRNLSLVSAPWCKPGSAPGGLCDVG